MDTADNAAEATFRGKRSKRRANFDRKPQKQPREDAGSVAFLDIAIWHMALAQWQSEAQITIGSMTAFVVRTYSALNESR